MDVEGNVYSLAKWTSLKAKDVKAKLRSPDHLPSVEDTRTTLRGKVTDQMRSYIQQVKARHENQLAPIYADRDEMVKNHRDERQNLKRVQAKRWAEEVKARQDRFSKGLRGALDWIIGKRKAIEDNNIQEAMTCAKRDQTQRDDLIAVEMKERRALQTRFATLRAKQREERKILAREIAASLQRLD